MSALSARRWRVRGQMVATGDSARRCARVDGVYSTPGVDGVYSTTVRVDDARCAAIGPMPAQACSGSAAVRSSEARRRRSFSLGSFRKTYAVIQALGWSLRWVPRVVGLFFALALCKHTRKQTSQP